jgi:hypothetical protein
MSRTLLLAPLIALTLSACSSIMEIRVPHGTEQGQPGAALDPVVIPRCKVLDSAERGACVLTVEQCKNGIAVIVAERQGRNTKVTIRCFVPNAVDDGSSDNGLLRSPS